MRNVITKVSKINGKGVFANRDFSKGEVVLEWSRTSDILTKEQVNSLPEEKKKYVSFHEGKFYFFKAPGVFMNHSCEANTKAVNACDIAVRDIKEGEEITCDYVAENVPGLKLVCKCGTPKCRKVLKG